MLLLLDILVDAVDFPKGVFLDCISIFNQTKYYYEIELELISYLKFKHKQELIFSIPYCHFNLKKDNC